jgi:DNA-binding MarR family transcriptional regulator
MIAAVTTIATATKPGWPPLGLLVGAVRRRLKQAVDVRARALGLSPQQFWVLMALAEMEGPSLGGLAARQHMDPPTASRVLTTLVRRGFARMATHPSDRRRAVLALTPRGRALAARVRPIALGLRAAVEQGFDPEEKGRLRAGLTRMLENLERFDPRVGVAHPSPRVVRRVAGERGGR